MPADGTLAASSPGGFGTPLRQLFNQDAQFARVRAKLAQSAWCTLADIDFMARRLAHRSFGGESQKMLDLPAFGPENFVGDQWPMQFRLKPYRT
jgi:hypothetical protein